MGAQDLVLLHGVVASKYPRVRRVTMSESGLRNAAGRPFAAFAGRPLYADVFEQAACLLEGIIRYHPFEDGNKRTALLAAWHFLRSNGHQMTLTGDVPGFLVGVARSGADDPGEVNCLIRKIAGRLREMAAEPPAGL